jgi:hypothetical protein
VALVSLDVARGAWRVVCAARHVVRGTLCGFPAQWQHKTLFAIRASLFGFTEQ